MNHVRISLDENHRHYMITFRHIYNVSKNPKKHIWRKAEYVKHRPLFLISLIEAFRMISLIGIPLKGGRLTNESAH